MIVVFIIYKYFFLLFLWNHSVLISADKMRKCKSTTSSNWGIGGLGLLSLFCSPKLCSGVVAAEKLMCSSSLSYTLNALLTLGDLEFGWQKHWDVQWKGNKQAIEVSLISEQADACDFFFPQKEINLQINPKWII